MSIASLLKLRGMGIAFSLRWPFLPEILEGLKWSLQTRADGGISPLSKPSANLHLAFKSSSFGNLKFSIMINFILNN